MMPVCRSCTLAADNHGGEVIDIDEVVLILAGRKREGSLAIQLRLGDLGKDRTAVRFIAGDIVRAQPAQRAAGGRQREQKGSGAARFSQYRTGSGGCRG